MTKPKSRTHASLFAGALIAVVFAILCVAVNTGELWVPALEARLGKEAPVTVRLPARYFRITMLRNEFHYLSTTSSSCPHLLPRGALLKRQSECTGVVRAFESSRRPPTAWRLLGLFAFYLGTALSLASFMRQKDLGRGRLLRSHITIFLLLFVTMLGEKAILLLTSFPAFVMPVLTVPLLTAFFFRKRMAFAVTLTTALLTSSLINFDIEILLVFLISGLVASLAPKKKRRSISQLKAGAIASWVAVFTTLITTLIFSGTLAVHDDIAEHLDPRYSLWISSIAGGLVSGLLAWALTPVVGLMVGAVSRSKLLDLQDLDQRLLKLLAERAPGTWEHSRAVANLAEAAASAIGANTSLVRAGSYYHDIGKSSRAEFFIENQAGGRNPHDDRDVEESAFRIIHHVSEGARILRKEGIPEDIVEFCFSHHGTSLLEFFWHKVLASGNPNGLSDHDFMYPGPKPSTRETGIVMLVDSIEAAARTIDHPDKAAFHAMVQQIVFSKLSQGQLDETGLSLTDLRVISNSLIETLVNMYHARIKYPWQTGDSGSIPREALVDDTYAVNGKGSANDTASARIDTTPIQKADRPSKSTLPPPAGVEPNNGKASNGANGHPASNRRTDR